MFDVLGFVLFRLSPKMSTLLMSPVILLPLIQEQKLLDSGKVVSLLSFRQEQCARISCNLNMIVGRKQTYKN